MCRLMIDTNILLDMLDSLLIAPAVLLFAI